MCVRLVEYVLADPRTIRHLAEPLADPGRATAAIKDGIDKNGFAFHAVIDRKWKPF